MNKFIELSSLPFTYDQLSPIISSLQLKLHYEKHHNAYVTQANELLKKIDATREDGEETDFGSIAKKISFNLSGDTLHNLFWHNLRKPLQNNYPEEKLRDILESQFGSLERFMSEFTEVALTIEGSGWASLIIEGKTGRLLLSQIQNHNLNYIASGQIVLVLDMWEHAYYVDYQNNKKKYIESFWRIIDWSRVLNRYENVFLDTI